MAKIKKDDLVVVIAGRDRGQQGRVLEVNTETDRVIVEGVNRVQRHIKAALVGTTPLAASSPSRRRCTSRT